MTNLIGALTTLETGNLRRSICCADVSRDLPGRLDWFTEDNKLTAKLGDVARLCQIGFLAAREGRPATWNFW
jgi:hypothetical protein